MWTGWGRRRNGDEVDMAAKNNTPHALPRRAEREEKADRDRRPGGQQLPEAVEVIAQERHRDVDVERRLADAEPIAEDADRVADVGAVAAGNIIGAARRGQPTLDEQPAADPAPAQPVKQVPVQAAPEHRAILGPRA